MTVDTIARAIKHGTQAHQPILIAIDGFGGSGKTTFAEKLRAALGSAYVVPMDDFIVKEKILEPSWDKGGFDRERLKRQVLKAATVGQSVSYQKLLWVENKLSEPIAVPAVDYLIVEGISSTHPDVARYFDYKIWVDTPIDIARERGRARDAGNENKIHWDLWSANDVRYQTKYRPERRADFVISGTA